MHLSANRSFHCFSTKFFKIPNKPKLFNLDFGFVSRLHPYIH